MSIGRLPTRRSNGLMRAGAKSRRAAQRRQRPNRTGLAYTEMHLSYHSSTWAVCPVMCRGKRCRNARINRNEFRASGSMDS